ncbi:DUF2480 family protein [Compostibacter hankyongensis]|uniref:DUF2480 family protein n=1 Tax=Compostibacter hankyongensis TaxID=1007089 RepID=A0ABP8FCB1_9BACT
MADGTAFFAEGAPPFGRCVLLNQSGRILFKVEKSRTSMDDIVNKVAASGLVTLDLGDYYPKEELSVFDLKPYLFMEQILKEKDFRQALKEIDWEAYRNKIVGITCSADAIIPMWAYMLVATYLQPVAAYVGAGTPSALLKQVFFSNLSCIDPETYRDKKIVIKGCGDKAVPEEVFVEISRLLLPVAASLMFGEPCSTVPVYKRKHH